MKKGPASDEFLQKIVLVRELLKIIFNEDIVSLLNTDGMWSDAVSIHAMTHFYPYLDEKHKGIL